MPQDPVVERAHADAATLPPRDPTQSLLTQLMTNTLDEDYAYVAGRRGDRADEPPGHHGRGVQTQLALVLVLVLFGGLVAVAALETAQGRQEVDRERAGLVAQIQARGAAVDLLREQTVTLQRRLKSLQSRAADGARQRQALADSLERLGMSAGTAPVTGPGVEVVVDDAPGSSGSGGAVRDVDLQTLVNGLWAAGAEAVAINGHRLSSLTSIRLAGEAITVDYRSLTRPYTVDAIGNPDTLPARFLDTQAGQTWLDLRTNFGLRFDMSTQETLTLPADPDARLTFASAGKGAP